MSRRILICQRFSGGDRKWELGVERDEIVLRLRERNREIICHEELEFGVIGFVV